MNTIVYIALSILFFGCTFACGYCCAMTKVSEVYENDAGVCENYGTAVLVERI